MDSYNFGTNHYKLDIEFDNRMRRMLLTDTYTGVEFSNAEYRYSAYIESNGKIFRLEGLYNPRVAEQDWRRGGKIITISGILGDNSEAPKVVVKHHFYIPDDGDYLEERIVLQNAGTNDLSLRGYRFGFRKKLEKPQRFGGPGIDIENYRIIALPFRLQPDGTKHDYTLNDLYYGRYQCSVFYNPARLAQEVVDQDRGRSEGWAWTDGENGLAVIKYNPNMIEYSMLDTEYIDGDAYMSFGGASPALYNEPVEARHIEPSSEMVFGKTRYHFYEGLWRRGAYIFRELMGSLGHDFPDDYNPPLNWNVLYNVGWYNNDREALAENYTLEKLEAEAKMARDMGCEVLYLDPGWEVCEGSTKWDTERLGSPADFVNKMRDEYGLKVGFRTVGRSYCNDYQGMYRLRLDGNTGYYAPYSPKPFYEPCYCSTQYQDEKLKRILEIADAGMSFIMFDEFDWRGSCASTKHGHDGSTTPNMHAKAVAELIRKVREKHPEILIEAHDPIWPWGVKYTPVYYLQNSENSFAEGWAFEFMWNPLEDLLSGKALSLFYYNLAYEVPLYLHIDMSNDNDNCLMFWWYASTVRHLGIGGGKDNPERFQAYKKAIAEYKSLRDLYTSGTFYGLDELTHIHVIPEEGRGVVNAFNLTDKPMSKKIEVRLNDLGLLEDVEVTGAEHQVIGGKLVLNLEIPPFSPVLVKMISPRL